MEQAEREKCRDRQIADVCALQGEIVDLECDVEFWKEQAFGYKEKYEIVEKENTLLRDRIAVLEGRAPVKVEYGVGGKK